MGDRSLKEKIKKHLDKLKSIPEKFLNDFNEEEFCSRRT